jgi:hypothetical protein
MALTRHLRLFLGPPNKRRFNARQVRDYLAGQSDATGSDEIGRVVERLPTILREPGMRRRYEGFQRYFDVLPRIIFLYHRGTPVAQISSELSFLATETGVETVVSITSQVLAERLNRLS